MVKLNIGDHGKPVRLIASVEEARILRNEKNHTAVTPDVKQARQIISRVEVSTPSLIWE